MRVRADACESERSAQERIEAGLPSHGMRKRVVVPSCVHFARFVGASARFVQPFMRIRASIQTSRRLFIVDWVMHSRDGCSDDPIFGGAFVFLAET